MKKFVLGMALFGVLGMTPAWASWSDDSSDEDCAPAVCSVDFNARDTQAFARTIAQQAAEAAAILCAADLAEFNSLIEATIEVMKNGGETTYRICRVRKSGKVKCSRKQILPASQVPDKQ